MELLRVDHVLNIYPSVIIQRHPYGDAIAAVQSHDLNRNPDILLVLGTSLKVPGLIQLVKEFAKRVHARPQRLGQAIGATQGVFFVNKTPPPGSQWNQVFDYWIKGDCDAWVDNVQACWRRLSTEARAPSRMSAESHQAWPSTFQSEILKEEGWDNAVPREMTALFLTNVSVLYVSRFDGERRPEAVIISFTKHLGRHGPLPH